MRVLIAPNALKESLDAFEAADAIGEGLTLAIPAIETDLLPVADGGDGTVRVLVRGTGGRFIESETSDALGRPVRAEWGMLSDGSAAIEIASAAGIAQLAAGERNPMIATSFGAGRLAMDALAQGCRRILVTLGGSATVDGGAGFVQALGARLLDARGAPIAPGGGGLAAIDRIDVANLDPRLRGVEIVVLCDVDNVLLGDEGAAVRFGPQKGASPDMVASLEQNLSRFADVMQRDLGADVRSLTHGGAAGGMAAGIAGVLGGRLVRGIDFLFDRLGFEERLGRCDLVVTAEGFLDRQTLANKAPYGVARAARRRNVPVVVMAGGVSDEAMTSEFSIFDAVFPICPRPMRLEDALSKARPNLVWAAEQLGKLIALRAWG